MIIIRRRALMTILIIFFFLSAFFSTRYLNRPRIRLGENLIYLNYRAKINPQKTYHLKCWDYQWPGINGEEWYQQFITSVIKDFEEENPNIKVDLCLLDFQSGPQQFSKALALGKAPDVYCSAYDNPEFNYEWQIPVGVFLKSEEINIYYPGLRKLLTLENHQLTLPRWAAPGIWIGNRALMEKAGLNVERIQKQGWIWDDLLKIRLKTEPICAGNFSANGLLAQLLSVGDSRTQGNNQSALEFISHVNGPVPQKFDYEVSMLPLFLMGKTMFLGGVRPIIYDFVKRKVTEGRIPWEAVLLPVPSEKPGGIILPVEYGEIGIYRHRKTKGDDQLAAAARLAYYLSICHQTAPWERLKVVPAVPAIAENWAKNLGEGYSNLIQWLDEGQIHNLEINRKYQEVVYPVLKSFLNGKISRPEMESLIKKYYFASK